MGRHHGRRRSPMTLELVKSLSKSSMLKSSLAAGAAGLAVRPRRLRRTACGLAPQPLTQNDWLDVNSRSGRARGAV